MAFEHWDSLSDEEKLEIASKAKKEHDGCGHHRCYWCGEPISSRNYDYTSDVRDPREICRGHCKGIRFFDNPK